MNIAAFFASSQQDILTHQQTKKILEVFDAIESGADIQMIADNEHQ